MTTYRVIGEPGSYLVQAQYAQDGTWYVLSGTYDTPEKAQAIMHDIADAKRREKAALKPEPTVIESVTV